MDLRNKTALVTGGAVRIGRAICEKLAGEGARVVIHYRSSRGEALALAKALGGVAIRSGLDSEKACARLVERTVKAAGPLDILVNNAACFDKQSLRETAEKNVKALFWPNLFAPLFLMKALAAQNRPAAVVNLLDRRIASLDTSCVPYVLTKKALAELTRMAAIELAPAIRVNAVAPGAILPPPGKGRDYLYDRAGPVPLKRQVTPGDVADAVVYLLHSESITGQIIYVDGGQNLLGNLKLET